MNNNLDYLIYVKNWVNDIYEDLLKLDTVASQVDKERVLKLRESTEYLKHHIEDYILESENE